MRREENLVETSTENAPLDPSEGLIVPDKKVSESTCLNTIKSPNLIVYAFFLQ